ncbi:hypothetical protein KY285_028730 [Solanum tuberosum]|nr:hypothetical protein KY285_028730 [Solanum tuberosum]
MVESGWPQSGIDRWCLVEAPVGSHSLLREPYVRLPPHTAPSRASVVGLGIKPLSMHVFSAWTDESFASRVVSNNGACVREMPARRVRPASRPKEPAH